MYLFARVAEQHTVEVVPGVSSPMACAAALGAPLAAQNDILTILPAPLETERLKERLATCDAAAIIKLGRHFPRIRDMLSDMKLIEQARYIERATMENERILPLDAVDPDASPYFSMILVHRRGKHGNAGPARRYRLHRSSISDGGIDTHRLPRCRNLQPLEAGHGRHAI